MNQEEYLSYVMLYLAEIDTNFSTNEGKIIKAKIGEEGYNKLITQYSQHTEDEKLNIIRNTAKELNIDKSVLQRELEKVALADGETSAIEGYLINMIKRFID
jgi:hypothetical protein